MTRRDYVAIGKALRAAHDEIEAGREVGQPDTFNEGRFTALAWVTRAIADTLEADNPRFDRARFLRFVETGQDTRRIRPTRTREMFGDAGAGD